MSRTHFGLFCFALAMLATLAVRFVVWPYLLDNGLTDDTLLAATGGFMAVVLVNLARRATQR